MKLSEIIDNISNDYKIWHIDSEYWKEIGSLTEEDLNSDESNWQFVKVELVLPDSYGQYIPMHFFKNFELEKWHVDPGDYQELLDPTHEHYLDTWIDLMESAYYIYNDEKYILYQNSDLYAIHFNE